MNETNLIQRVKEERVPGNDEPETSGNDATEEWSTPVNWKNILPICITKKFLDQETAKRPFRSFSQSATGYYQSKHSKVEAILLKGY